MNFSIKDYFGKCDLVTFTAEILNGKLRFLCSDITNGGECRRFQTFKRWKAVISSNPPFL